MLQFSDTIVNVRDVDETHTQYMGLLFYLNQIKCMMLEYKSKTVNA